MAAGMVGDAPPVGAVSLIVGGGDDGRVGESSDADGGVAFGVSTGMVGAADVDAV